jgi:ADP-ribose pyrophosphatase
MAYNSGRDSVGSKQDDLTKSLMGINCRFPPTCYLQRKFSMSDEKWSVIKQEQVLVDPYVTVTMQEVRLPNGRIISDWPYVHTRDYANVLVLDSDDRVMVLEGYKHGLGKSSWQVVGGYLEPGEEPLMAIQRELREETGYFSDEWTELGHFVVDANRHVGVGTFFLARNARKIAEPDHDDLEHFDVRWVSLPELKIALFDGRVGIISYAANIALGLLHLDSEA